MKSIFTFIINIFLWQGICANMLFAEQECILKRLVEQGHYILRAVPEERYFVDEADMQNLRATYPYLNDDERVGIFLKQEAQKHYPKNIYLDIGSGTTLEVLELNASVKQVVVYAPKNRYEYAPNIEDWLGNKWYEDSRRFEEQIAKSPNTKIFYQAQDVAKGSVLVLRLGDFPLHNQVGALVKMEFANGIILWHSSIEDAAAMGNWYYDERGESHFVCD